MTLFFLSNQQIIHTCKRCFGICRGGLCLWGQGIDARQVCERLVVLFGNAPQGVGGGGEANSAFSLGLLTFVADVASTEVLNLRLCACYDRNGKFSVNAKAFAIRASAATDGRDVHERIGKGHLICFCLVTVWNLYLLRRDLACIIRECEMYAASTA